MPGSTCRSEKTGEWPRCSEVNGTDTVVFGYTVQADDLDQDGVSVESGGPGTGMTYNSQNRDGGLWSSETTSGRINRIFHGLDDDPGHIVKPTDQDIDETDADAHELPVRRSSGPPKPAHRHSRRTHR